MFTFPLCHWAGGAAVRIRADPDDGHLERGADLTGNADSKLWLFSLWFRPDSDLGPEDLRVLFTTGTLTNVLCSFSWASFGAGIRWFGANTADYTILQIHSVSSIAAGAGWQHVMGSVDLADTAKRHLVLNDAADMNVLVYTDEAMDFTKADHFVGDLSGGDGRFDGCLAEVYLNFGTYMDLSVEANKRKFITANKTPADLGADGSKPTGAKPIVYLKGPVGNWGTNFGTGGDFTVTGSPPDCSTSP